MNKRRKSVNKHNTTNSLLKVLKNMKIILEISRVIKEIHKLFW